MLPAYPNGNAEFSPPIAIPRSISATSAFRIAWAYGGDPGIATGPGRLARVSYSNYAYGAIQSDGSVELTYQKTPVWVLVFPVDGSIDESGGSPLHQGQRQVKEAARTGCMIFSIVRADTGEALTTGEQCR